MCSDIEALYKNVYGKSGGLSELIIPYLLLLVCSKTLCSPWEKQWVYIYCGRNHRSVVIVGETVGLCILWEKSYRCVVGKTVGLYCG